MEPYGSLSRSFCDGLVCRTGGSLEALLKLGYRHLMRKQCVLTVANSPCPIGSVTDSRREPPLY